MVVGLLIGLAAAGQGSAASQPNQPPAIVVTGERISDLRARLRACIARKCPPNEDVDATLALAEGEFLNGEYARAEQDIAASIARNRQHRRAYPEPVADLYRAQARVQSHRGRDDLAAHSAHDILRTLRAGLPEEDHRHFTARLEIVQAELKRGSRHGVLRELRELKEAASRAGRDDVARRASMQELQFRYELAPSGEPARRLAELAASEDPRQAYEAVAARFFLARVYRSRGEIDRADAMLARLPRGEASTRTLLYAPRIRLVRAEAEPTLLAGMDVDNFEDTWIDVGFWIQPSGRVDDVEILRRGANAAWADPVLDSIRGRIYSASADGAPSYRLERFTYTASVGRRTGSRLMMRTGTPRIEYLDLTTPREPGHAPTEPIVAPTPLPSPAS
jgi:hypothetical protein